MANITVVKSARKPLDFMHLYAERKQLHWPYVPTSVYAKMSVCRFGPQMAYSLQMVEDELFAKGNPHALYLDLGDYDEAAGSSASEPPKYWDVYADGVHVAHGDGAFVRACFETGADEFRDVCRKAVLAANLEKLTVAEYRQLVRVRTMQHGKGVSGGKYPW